MGAVLTMNRGTGKPLTLKNDFAAGFGALEEAEKQAKRDAKKAAKRAELEKAAAEEAARIAANPELQQKKAEEPKRTMSWADCDEDDDVFGLSPFNDKSEQEYELEKKLEEGLEDDEDDEEDDDDMQAQSPQVELTPIKQAAAPAEAKKQMSKKELKENEMADLDAILNEMGVQPGEEKEKKAEPEKEAEPAENEEQGEKKKSRRGGKKKKGG